MTYLPLQELERRRSLGLSPKCGPVPEDKFRQIVGTSHPQQMLSTERKKELHVILRAAWDHPGDTRLWQRAFELLGQSVPVAHLHVAADYVHRCENQTAAPFERNDIYDSLMKMAGRR
jgi:hypothetical protein